MASKQKYAIPDDEDDGEDDYRYNQREDQNVDE